MINHKIKALCVSCFFLLLLTGNQLFILEAMVNPRYISHTANERSNLGGSSISYEEYAIETLEFLLNHNWDAETNHFFSDVGRTGTALVLPEYIALEQITSINALSYIYPQVENETLRMLILDRLRGATNSLIHDFGDDSGAILAAYPQENNPPALFKYALYQLYASSALIAAYNQLEDENYLSRAKMAADFALQQLWDETNGGFYFSEFNGSLSFIKDTQSQAIAISSLTHVFDQFGAEIYLERAQQTLDFALTYLWDNNHTGFYDFSNAEGDVTSEGREKRVVTQALMLRALSAMYHQTKDPLYLDYINQTISFSMAHLWDSTGRGFVASSSEDGLIPDDSMAKSSNKQFYMILGLLDAQEVYQNLSPEFTNYLFSIVFDTLDFVVNNLWDTEHTGFYIAMDMMREIQETNKFTISQALGVEVLQKILETERPIMSNLRIDPLAPTPSDTIKISITISESDSIDDVILVYSLNMSDTYTIPMVSRGEGRYEAQVGPFPHGTSVNFVVEINNSSGEEFVGYSFSVLVTEDRIGPAVHLREINPSSPSAVDPIEIIVHTIDDRLHIPVERVTLSYRIVGDEWEILELSPIDEEHFKGIIGPFPSNSLIEFYFTGYDAFGNAAETGASRIEIAPEQRTIAGFEWIGALVALASWICIRFYRASRHSPFK